MKHCSKCFEVMPESNEYFYSRKSKKGGRIFRSDCKGCTNDVKKVYYQRNKSVINSKSEEYRKKHREELKSYHSAYNKIHYQKNKNKHREKNKRHYEQNKKSYRARTIKWREKNADKYKKINRDGSIRRRARTAGLLSSFTSNQWQQCLSHFNHQCAYCGSTESLEQEHVIPVSRGGHYTPDNIIPACRSCNASKNNKIMQDWFTQQEIYSVERMANILKYVQKNKTEVNI